MREQTGFVKSLGKSRAGAVSLASALTLAAMLSAGDPARGFAQEAPAAQPAKPNPEKKAEPETTGKKVGQYIVHQSLEVGGRITETQGSQAMWNTLVDMGSGARVLGESLDMRSTDRAKTPFFDTLTSSSFGYGGDPNSVSFLNASKGRIYDFAGSFRRDRQYFDYNLLANSLNTSSAGLVPEIDSPHLFNTVRRNTDALLTLMPLSRVSYRAGFNYNVGAGPSYSSVHEGADALLLQNWHNLGETYTGGVDLKVARRTTVSYDQFYVHYKGNTGWQLAGLNARLADGTPVSYGLDPGSRGCPGVTGGVGSATCNGYLSMSIYEPTRTNFPTEQLRFASRYWERLSLNGRVLYSAGKSVVPSYYEAFDGLVTRTGSRGEIDTGAGPGGRLATVKRDNVNADFGAVLELNRTVSLSEAYDFWDFRIPGSNEFTTTVFAGHSMLTPGTATAPVTTQNFNFLNQKVHSETVLGIFTVTPQIRLSAGYRYRFRNITDARPVDRSWKENWALIGGVFQPGPKVRISVNYEGMRASSDKALTPSDTYTRVMPDKVSRFKARATVKAAKWVDFAVSGIDYEGKNDDAFVNHRDHNHDLSGTVAFHPAENLTIDLDLAHDDVFSLTDDCYVTSAQSAGSANTGTCTAANSGGAGGTAYFLSDAYYHAPAAFFSGAIDYSPTSRIRIEGGIRLYSVDGQAEVLNPNMVPGALQSKYLTPFSDVQFKIAREWAWHGSWTRNDYAEQGPFGITAPRNVHGDTATLSVKYEF